MSTRILLTIREDQADSQRIDELAIALRRELFDLGVDKVESVAEGRPPANARGLEAVDVGTLLVTLTQSARAVGAIIALVRSWLGSASTERSVELTVGDTVLKLSSATEEQQDQLIGEFIRELNRT